MQDKFLTFCAVLFVILLGDTGLAFGDNVPLESLRAKRACYKSLKCTCPTQKIDQLDLNATCGRADGIDMDVSRCQNRVIAYNDEVMKYNADVENCSQTGSRDDLNDRLEVQRKKAGSSDAAYERARGELSRESDEIQRGHSESEALRAQPSDDRRSQHL